MTDLPAIPSPLLLDSAIPDKTPEDPRHDLLMVSELGSDGRKSDWLHVGANCAANTCLAFSELKTVTLHTRDDRTAGAVHELYDRGVVFIDCTNRLSQYPDLTGP